MRYPSRYWLHCILIVFSSCSASAQEFSLKETVDYKQEYLECQQNYDELKRIVGMGKAVPDTYYLNDELYSGSAKNDSPDSKMYEITYFKDGFIEKRMVYFYNGLKSADFTFKDGQPHGYHNMYFDSGQKYIEEFFIEGLPEGFQRRWHANGELAREVLYKDGAIQYEYLFDKDGNKITDE